MSAKIAFLLTSTGWGGLEMNTIKLARLFSAKNRGPLIFNVEGSRFKEGCQKIDCRQITIERQRKYFDFKKGKRLAQLLKENQIDVLMVFDTRDLNLAFLVKRFYLKNLKVIYQQHMQIGVNKKDILHTMTYRALNYWVSPLQWLKQQVLEKTRTPEKKIKIIPLGVETEKFLTFNMNSKEARQKFAIDSDKTLVGIVGRIAPYKGQKFLVEAISEMRQRGFDIELLIVGEPTVNEQESLDYLEEIKQFINEKNLGNHIYLRSYIQDVRPFYQAINVFALASQAETYGMVTLEAMLSEKIIIATNTSGTPEILQQGKLGYLYPPQNVGEFCNQLEIILQNQGQAKEKAREAKKHASEYFSASSECEQLLALIDSLFTKN